MLTVEIAASQRDVSRHAALAGIVADEATADPELSRCRLLQVYPAKSLILLAVLTTHMRLGRPGAEQLLSPQLLSHNASDGNNVQQAKHE
jgi:hypothetical protein